MALEPHGSVVLLSVVVVQKSHTVNGGKLFHRRALSSVKCYSPRGHYTLQRNNMQLNCFLCRQPPRKNDWKANSSVAEHQLGTQEALISISGTSNGKSLGSRVEKYLCPRSCRIRSSNIGLGLTPNTALSYKVKHVKAISLLRADPIIWQ